MAPPNLAGPRRPTTTLPPAYDTPRAMQCVEQPAGMRVGDDDDPDPISGLSMDTASLDRPNPTLRYASLTRPWPIHCGWG